MPTIYGIIMSKKNGIPFKFLFHFLYNTASKLFATQSFSNLNHQTSTTCFSSFSKTKMLVSKLETLLSKSLTIKQSNQIHGLLLITNLNHQFEPFLIQQILNSNSHSNTDYIKSILYHMKNPDAYSWSYTIRSLSQHNQFTEAFALYTEMHSFGLNPTTFAISAALKSCAKTAYDIGGVSIHAQVFKHGFCEDVYAQTAVVNFYAKWGKMDYARKVFDEMGERNVVTWNSILAGYLKSENLAMAHMVFHKMPIRDIISWNSMISSYGRVGNMDQANMLFNQMPEKNIASWNSMISGYLDSGEIGLARTFFDSMSIRNNVSWISMISGYSRCGDVAKAKDLFDEVSDKDLLLYNAMIACYSQNSRSNEALQLFNEMLNLNIQPDKMTLSCAISACSQLGDLRFGSQIESLIKEQQITIDNHLATALIDLNAKCGNMDKAYSLFQGLRKKDLIAYTAMILGCGINGRTSDAIKLFEEMVNLQIYPNLVTYTGILTAYNHVGLVEEGYKCFISMQKHGLEPSADHFGIMVELLGRAGKLDVAYELIKSMPMTPHAGVWGALLLACNLHNNVEFGEIAAKHCFELEPDTTGYRSLLANIYVSVGRWDDAKSLQEEKLEEDKGFRKVPGCSWTEAS